MPSFSPQSKQRLATCHLKLQRLFNEVIQHFDCIVVEGHRDKARQNRLLKEGKTQLAWPKSKHNAEPARAVDVIPCPVDWSDRERFTYFAGFVMGTAAAMGIPLRWGGNWSGDTILKNNNFDDLGHFELKGDQA